MVMGQLTKIRLCPRVASLPRPPAGHDVIRSCTASFQHTQKDNKWARVFHVPRRYIEHTVRGMSGMPGPRGMKEPEFPSLEPRGIRGRRYRPFINFRRGRLQGHQREQATRGIGLSRTYLTSPWVLLPQLTDATAEANPRTECPTLATSFRNSFLLGLGFPMSECTGHR